MKPIVFLHIPKTAGQTIHHALADMVGAANVSPIRVNDQVKENTFFPDGFRLHSGHIDWKQLDGVAGDPFVFTVLRDPAERLASFYFHSLNAARNASAELLSERQGLQRILNWTIDDFFFAGDDSWQWFIKNYYFNFITSYLATRQMHGRQYLGAATNDEIIAKAMVNVQSINGIYDVQNLTALEADIRSHFGKRIKVAGRYSNQGALPQDKARWSTFYRLFESDISRTRIESFVDQDYRLQTRLRGLSLIR